MADPHNHTHQRRHTPRRRAWATLAIGALLATLLTIAAAPAAVAAPRQADQQAQWKACLGPATQAAGFTDVGMDSVHYDNINCLAYYGITTGTSADTYNPGAHVTRSQMALFLTRMADVAGVTVDDAMDAGFADLDGIGDDRVKAINRLANAGIMQGRTATSFDPLGHVTRADMALHLFAFLDLALDSVLIDTLPRSIDGDGTGHIELNSQDGEVGTPVDDYFGDARRLVPAHVDDAIGAIYELGVTNGTNSQVGERGTFDPFGNVTRAQMASFIMRALGHTNLRPAGLTAQSTSNDTQVSVRTDDFKPMGGVRTEVFTTNFPADAFNTNGACISRFVTNQSPSHNKCRVDFGDLLTDADTGNALWEGVGIAAGNALTITCTATGENEGTADPHEYTFMTGTRGSETDYTVFAWTDMIGEEAHQDSLFQSEPANTLVSTSEAVKAVVTGGTGLDVKMGHSLTYTVQLRDAKGNDVGPAPGVNYNFNVKVDTFRAAAQTSASNGTRAEMDAAQVTADANIDYDSEDFTRVRSVREPDEDGQFTIVVGFRDPTRLRNNPDAGIVVTIETAEGNELYVVNMTMPMGDGTLLPTTATAAAMDAEGLTTTGVKFSDNPSVPDKVEASSATWRLRIPGASNGHSITASVNDQYGDLYRGGTHQLAASDTENATDFPTDEGANLYVINTSGRRSIGYTHTGERPLTQDIDLDLWTRGETAAATDPAIAGSASVHWADRGQQRNDTTGTPILLGDTAFGPHNRGRTRST